MGNSTYYDLEIEKGEDSLSYHKENINKITGYVYGVLENNVKWYSHEDDMKAYSEKYPNTVFKLSGEGEENEDIWDKYFKNGKMQICRAIITFNNYNESKLK